MPNPDLCTEEEVARLVHTFYAKLHNDAMLAPIFESRVADWDRQDGGLLVVCLERHGPLQGHANAQACCI